MPGLALVLSLMAGYVDTAGFLALHGLFTAHVTGNFVTIGASLVFGTSGLISKLLALPVFCVAIALVRACGGWLARRSGSEILVLLGVQVLLLGLGAALAVWHGPFPDSDSPPAMLTGMVLVAAMAVQNALHRIYLPTSPPSTLMTGSTTQVVIDAVDLLRRLPEEQKQAARQRLSRLGRGILAFAMGCAAAAGLFLALGHWCFAVPPLLGLLAMWRAPHEAAKA